MHCSVFPVCAALILTVPAKSQDVFRVFTLNPIGATSVTSEFIVKASNAHEFSYSPLGASRPGTIKAWDVSRGRELAVRMADKKAGIAMPPVSSEKSELRVRIEEIVPGTGLTLNRVLPKGRYVVNLPAGYVVESCSLPAQIQAPDGRIAVGIVQRGDVPVPLQLRIRRDSGAACQRD